MRRQAYRRRVMRTALVAANAVILAVVAVFVLQNSKSNAVQPSLSTVGKSAVAANPLDQLSSANIALTVARMSSLPETVAITNQADSQIAELATAPTSDNAVTKPQVVTTALKSRANIAAYTVATGDNVASLAAKFGITSDSIRWSNGLSSDSLSPGLKIVIPPVNGVVYTVKPGDTAESLAGKYRANKDKIIAYNDAEISGLRPGTQIIIPDGTLAVATTATQIVRSSSNISSTLFPWGGAAPVYGYNGYDFGYCTWYVANKISVPSNWGNASTWDNYAPRSGWRVSTRPIPGSIAQKDNAAGGLGHVAYVEAVSDDGTMMKYSDMNGLAGFGRIGYSDWVPISKFPLYIYR